jgi:hypothetical protein
MTIKEQWKSLVLVGRPPTGYKMIGSRLTIDPDYRGLVVDILYQYFVKGMKPSHIGLIVRHYRQKYPGHDGFDKRRIERIIERTSTYLGYVLIDGSYHEIQYLSEPLINKRYLRSTSLTDHDISRFEKALIDSGHPRMKDHLMRGSTKDHTKDRKVNSRRSSVEDRNNRSPHKKTRRSADTVNPFSSLNMAGDSTISRNYRSLDHLVDGDPNVPKALGYNRASHEERKNVGGM